MFTKKLKLGLSGNALKIIALIAMTIDHIGVILYPSIDFLRIIGRISMPIFAYLIAEGCKYTRNKLKHFLTVFILGALCQVVFFVAENSLEMGILIVFSFSILTIYALQYAIERKKWFYYILPTLAVGLAFFCNYALAEILGTTKLVFDYGIAGMMLPVFIFAFNDKWIKLLVTAVALIPVCLVDWNLQWYCYLALIPLALYNGKRGKYNIKYLFYLYYPAHLVALYLINILM